jgi:hypothetical protein
MKDSADQRAEDAPHVAACLRTTAERVAAWVASNKRLDGAFRGSSTDRPASLAWLSSTFGYDTHVGCVYRGKILSDVTVTPGEMFTWPDGGRYDHGNILPACVPFNAWRKDAPISTTMELGA